MHRPGSLFLVLILALVVSACGVSPSDEAADLCNDLDHLRGTIGFLAAPKVEATVGLVRSAVDKLDPTFTRVAASETVPEVVGSRLVEAQEAYAAVLEPYGDDESFEVVAVAVAQPARRLVDAVASVEDELGCRAR